MDNKLKILQELHEVAPHLALHNKTNVYNVEDNYFNNLPKSILSKIKSPENELSKIAPTLNSISKQNVYTVPSNYFKLLHVNIPATKSSAKIISIKQINIFIKYAVAASVAAIIFTGSFLFNHHSSNNNNIATINVTNDIKNISDDELDKYANEHSIQFTDDGFKDDNDELNVQAELKTVSNEELQQYYSEYLAARAK